MKLWLIQAVVRTELSVVIPGQHDCGDQKHLNRSLSMDEASAYLLVRTRTDISETNRAPEKTLLVL